METIEINGGKLDVCNDQKGKEGQTGQKDEWKGQKDRRKNERKYMREGR